MCTIESIAPSKSLLLLSKRIYFLLAYPDIILKTDNATTDFLRSVKVKVKKASNCGNRQSRIGFPIGSTASLGRVSDLGYFDIARPG
jgi:hypothetical protein